jgi:CheY-like chemotaxis protein
MPTDHDLILYVDDEVQALKYFRLGFEPRYQVRTAASVAEAWTILDREGERVAMVISDQRMPGKTGIELLEEVKERYPRMLRLLTTAYADLSSAIAAVNRGSVYAYINKPWNLEELQLTIARAFDHLRLQRERDLLLVEKLGVYQHLLLIDRLRSLGLLASVCSAWVRRPLAGAAAFWRDSAAHFAHGIPAVDPTADLWQEMLGMTRRLAEDGRRLGAWFGAHRSEAIACRSAAASTASAIAVAQPALRPRTVAGLASLAATPDLLNAGLAALAGWLLDLVGGAAGGATGLVDAVGGDDGLTVTLIVDGDGRIDGPGAGDLGGLQGYLAIHHHGGTVQVDGWSRRGGTVTARVPARDPQPGEDQGLDDLLGALTRLER